MRLRTCIFISTVAAGTTALPPLDPTVVPDGLAAFDHKDKLEPQARQHQQHAATDKTSTGRPAGWLAAFTLVRGGADFGAYETFLNSRRCLRAALPAVIAYDDFAFHEGNVPSEVQLRLRQEM
jgi:hypothetical protein